MGQSWMAMAQDGDAYGHSLNSGRPQSALDKALSPRETEKIFYKSREP